LPYLPIIFLIILWIWKKFLLINKYIYIYIFFTYSFLGGIFLFYLIIYFPLWYDFSVLNDTAETEIFFFFFFFFFFFKWTTLLKQFTFPGSQEGVYCFLYVPYIVGACMLSWKKKKNYLYLLALLSKLFFFFFLINLVRNSSVPKSVNVVSIGH